MLALDLYNLCTVRNFFIFSSNPGMHTSLGNDACVLVAAYLYLRYTVFGVKSAAPYRAFLKVTFSLDARETLASATYFCYVVKNKGHIQRTLCDVLQRIFLCNVRKVPLWHRMGKIMRRCINNIFSTAIFERFPKKYAANGFEYAK